MIVSGEMMATAVATQPCKLLKIDNTELTELCDDDPELAYGLMRELAKATLERLNSTRILLAAATSPV